MLVFNKLKTLVIENNGIIYHLHSSVMVIWTKENYSKKFGFSHGDMKQSVCFSTHLLDRRRYKCFFQKVTRVKGD